MEWFAKIKLDQMISSAWLWEKKLIGENDL